VTAGGTEPLTGPWASALERGRGAYNARFALARRTMPGLDEHALLELLRGLDPAIRACHAHDAAALDRVADALFDAAVELAGRSIAGPSARSSAVDAGWRAVLAAAPRQVCLDPRRVAAAVANALTNLAECPGARIDAWVRSMTALAALADDVATWLGAGTVAAWLSGVAHARAGALAVCASLPVPAAALALGMDAATPAETLGRVLERLRVDPWAWPAAVATAQEPPSSLKVIAFAGGFRGFAAGPFVAPPRVGWHDGAFVASDGLRTFFVHANIGGVTFTPAGSAPLAAAAAAGITPAIPAAITLTADGAVQRGDERRDLPMLAHATSWVSDGATLLATRAISHRIAVVVHGGYGS
jgi:hypothetical protein